MQKFFSNFWENYKEYIVLVLLLTISLIILSQNKTPAVKNVRAIAFGSFAIVTSLANDIFSTGSLKAENENLRRENAEMMLKISRLREYGILNEELKQLLEIKDSTDLPLIPAHVVSRTISQSQGTITLNAGAKDSVKTGMPVLSGNGLVGIVYTTSEDYSIARTLKNVDLKITVQSERSRFPAIMKWNGEEHVLINVPKTYDVKIGDRIITSEISSIIPVPLPVGVVSRIENRETGIFNDVIIQPFTDVQSVEHVFVIGIVQSKQKEDLELNFLRSR